MMQIWTIDNKKQKKLLRSKLKEFDFNDLAKKEIDDLVREMDKSMQEADGIGLSANQVGLDMRVFVARWDGKFYAVFNPEIKEASKEKTLIEAGCLSIPNKYGEVERAESVVLHGYNKQGKKIKIRAWGMLAHIFQHEVDHLQGKLFTDRMKRGAELKSRE